MFNDCNPRKYCSTYWHQLWRGHEVYFFFVFYSFFFILLLLVVGSHLVVVVVACCFASVKSCVFGAISKITSHSYCWVLNGAALSRTWTGWRPGGGLGGAASGGLLWFPHRLHQIWRWELFHLIRVFISRSYVAVLYMLQMV